MAPNRDLSNILESNSENTLIPHHAEYNRLYSKVSVLTHLKDFDFWVCGGWPLAVLAAPRTPARRGITQGFFSDYDIYAASIDTLDAICSKLSSLNPNDIHVSDNARSYHFDGGVNIQVIYRKEGVASPQEVISGFDFVNCAIAYRPSNDTVYFHRDLITAHVNGELEILEPWMLDEVNEETLGNVITQLIRFYKYCSRWEYVLSEASVKKLIEVYSAHPDITLLKDKAYGVGSGSMKKIASANQNVWTALSGLLIDSPHWHDNLDIHGKITGSDPNQELVIEFDEWSNHEARLNLQEEKPENSTNSHATSTTATSTYTLW